MTTTLSLIVNGARSPAPRSISELKDAVVGVQAATTDYEAALVMKERGEIGGIEVYPFDRIEHAMADLEAGRIAAVMKVAPVATWLAAKHPGLHILAQVPADPQPLGIGFRKSETALLAAVKPRACRDAARRQPG
jgi:ABC-type amino acid transport substrate-binding protein